MIFFHFYGRTMNIVNLHQVFKPLSRL